MGLNIPRFTMKVLICYDTQVGMRQKRVHKMIEAISHTRIKPRFHLLMNKLQNSENAKYYKKLEQYNWDQQRQPKKAYIQMLVPPKKPIVHYKLVWYLPECGRPHF